MFRFRESAALKKKFTVFWAYFFFERPFIS